MIRRPAPSAIIPSWDITLKLFLIPRALKPSPAKGFHVVSDAGIEKYPSIPNSNIITPIGPISGLEIILIRLFFGLCLSDSFLEIFNEFIIKYQKKVGEKTPTLTDFKNYLSTPANEATEEALLLSTNPGPDGILAPGSKPAPLLYKCKTIIGIYPCSLCC